MENNVQAEDSAFTYDLEEIDEQIEQWKTVNVLEIKREEVIDVMKRKAPDGQERVTTVMRESIEPIEDEDNFDIDTIDWRSKLL